MKERSIALTRARDLDDVEAPAQTSISKVETSDWILGACQ